ncbi:MAG: hypothetical protein JXR77_07065 [Lentisphaeria bacterium]|nr:hypothetical protein [Lentisphaeria bacterium]
MRPGDDGSPVLPPAPARLFLVGVGGIGMSALAQYLLARGYAVGGSDRLLAGPGRDTLIRQLAGLGVAIFPQDGSGPAAFAPDALVISAAVEPGNADLVAAKGCTVLPRAHCLAQLLSRDGGCQIAVAGSAGKTSVTGWLGSTLRALGRRVLVVNGGTMIEVESALCPGNFLAEPDPEFLVVEVDESDRSLVAFSPHVGIVLNVGTDHYCREDLLRVFGSFLDGCRRACVLHRSLAAALAPHGPRKQRFLFGDAMEPGVEMMAPSDYRPCREGSRFRLGDAGEVVSCQFGRHSATNAAAVVAGLRAAGVDAGGAALSAALGRFPGIRQRFELMGRRLGRPVYHDYAHNVEKIAAAIGTARDAAGAGQLILFQPHGYGPLGFMRKELGRQLARVLGPGDLFALLPVYYAGGSTSFRPTSAEVAAEWSSAGLPAVSLACREDAVGLCPGDFRAFLVLGARDPTLPSFAASLCAPDAGPGGSRAGGASA